MASVESDQVVELRKISSVLGLMLVREMATVEKIATMSACGFTNKDIAALLGTTEGSVRAQMSQQRRRGDAKGKRA